MKSYTLFLFKSFSYRLIALIKLKPHQLITTKIAITTREAFTPLIGRAYMDPQFPKESIWYHLFFQLFNNTSILII